MASADLEAGRQQRIPSSVCRSGKTRERAVPALTFHAAFIFRKRRSYYKKKGSIISETNVINLNPAVESLSFLTPRLSFAISSDINHHILYLPFNSVTNRANDNSPSVVPRSCGQLLPTSLGGKGGASLILHMKILMRNRFALVNCELSCRRKPKTHKRSESRGHAALQLGIKNLHQVGCGHTLSKLAVGGEN